jgi:hypothetical protein
VFNLDLGLTGAARPETPRARERETIISKERIEEIKERV